MEIKSTNPKTNKYKIDWKQFELLCKKLSEQIHHNYSSLYPIHKNGLYIAVELNKILNIPIKYELEPDSLIIDDLIDSGKTLEPYKDYDKAVLFVKNNNDNKVTYYAEKSDAWIVLPWEKEDDIEDTIIRQLEYIGEDANREGLKDTPKRIVKSWDKLFGGYNQNPIDFIKVFENECYDEMVMLKDIEFYSTCEHHMLPFFGKIHIAYIPSNKVIGISKLARIVEVYTRRLQIQERLTAQIANCIKQLLRPEGVMVLIEAQHFCMTSRGIEKQNSKMVTSALKGAFKNIKARQEFLRLIK